MKWLHEEKNVVIIVAKSRHEKKLKVEKSTRSCDKNDTVEF
jgi:hypothetical protein